MPGPTTEVLNEDIKEIKAEIKDIRSNLDVLKADVHRVDVSLAELRSDVRSAISIGKWAATLFVATILTGGVTAIWQAATMNNRLGSLESRFDKYEAKAEARLDRIEAAVTKALGKESNRE
jgi:hypothetical protein